MTWTATESLMLLALAEAEEAFLRGDVPVGAVLVKGGEVVGRGSNVAGDPTAHAEILAIREGAATLGARNLTDCDLYVTLEPCPMCAGAAVTARLRTIVFGARDPKAGAVGTLYDIPRDGRLNHRCRALGGVLEGRCAEILRRYFMNKRRK
ncbi:MAG: nucleoside deaminase [Synergistaceae bacterium]|jgi:tRNA(adenine34) deaminase|nr:nucleoside deaminase [Synergistaceae bacterium]